MWNGTLVVTPFAVSVQTIFWVLANSFGMVTTNMPNRRRVRKWVGWPRSGLPGSKWLFGPIGMSTSACVLRL